MSEIATPKTDAQAFKRLFGDIKASSDVVQADFARRLERELAVARGALVDIRREAQDRSGWWSYDVARETLTRLDAMSKQP